MFALRRPSCIPTVCMLRSFSQRPGSPSRLGRMTSAKLPELLRFSAAMTPIIISYRVSIRRRHIHEHQGSWREDANEATGINNAGHLVGDAGGGQARSGFLKSGDVFTRIINPDAIRTEVAGINDRGEMVGSSFFGGLEDMKKVFCTELGVSWI